MSQHDLDLEVADLAKELAKPPNVDRTLPGFEDFALEGSRGVEPGRPALSLLFHAFASPRVVSFRRNGTEESLTSFPTLAEIEDIENYV